MGGHVDVHFALHYWSSMSLSDPAQAPTALVQITIEFTRTTKVGNPYGFQLRPQKYMCRIDGGNASEITVNWSDELWADLGALVTDQCEPDMPQRLGHKLERILRGTGWPVQHERIMEVTSQGSPSPVRITIMSDAAEIYALPWELLTLEESGQHLCELPSVLVRYTWRRRWRGRPSAESASERAHAEGRIVLAWSDSHGAVPHAEHRQILEGLTKGAGADSATSAGGWCGFVPSRDEISNASYEKLKIVLEEANDVGPVSVLHVLCHGATEGKNVGLGFYDPEEDHGKMKGKAVMHGSHLRELLAPYAEQLRMVVLAACDSGNSGAFGNELGSVAQNLHRVGIETVIASRMPLSLRGSVKFAKAFYSTLISKGKDAENALLQGRKAMAPRNDRYSVQMYMPPRAEAKIAEARPRYRDERTKRLSEQLEEAYERRERLEQAGVDIAKVQHEILQLKRELRAGGRLRAGDQLGDDRYLLMERVGRGGFAEVWKARDEVLQKYVAIKVLHSYLAGDVIRRERFYRGAQKMGILEQEGVVRVLEPHGEDDKYHYFVMEYVEGGNLHEAVIAQRVGPKSAYPLLRKLSAVLAEVHERGMIHRDVKPQNVLLTSEKEAKLADFDLVGAKDTTVGTRTGAMGTFLYAAPEMLDRPQDAKASVDVYGLGMTMLFVANGGPLPIAVLFGNRAGFIDQLGLEKELSSVLKRAIAVKSEGRFQDGRELCEALSVIEKRASNRLRAASRSYGTSSEVEMVKIPAGCFLMGSSDDDDMARDNEEPQHRVRVSEFACMKYPVSEQLWQQVTKKGKGEGDKRPVTGVSWFEAVEFCNQLSLQEEMEPCYKIVGKQVEWVSNEGYRLLTEAEWEYGCRAGTETRWWFGDDKSQLRECAWYRANASAPQPVGRKTANPWGLYDMHGNVWEWCWDWYGKYKDKERNDPRGPTVGQERVLRGGSFGLWARVLRSALRFGGHPRLRVLDYGFRMARGGPRPLFT